MIQWIRRSLRFRWEPSDLPPFSPFFYFFLFETLSCGNAFGLDFWLRYNMTELSTFFPFFFFFFFR